MLGDKIIDNGATSKIIKVAAIVGSIIAIAGGYTWYKNNFWKPTVKVDSVDYNSGVAQLTLNGKKVTLLGDAAFSATANWAVRFGGNRLNGDSYYDRIELTKFGNVVEYVDMRKSA